MVVNVNVGIVVMFVIDSSFFVKGSCAVVFCFCRLRTRTNPIAIRIPRMTAPTIGITVDLIKVSLFDVSVSTMGSLLLLLVVVFGTIDGVPCRAAGAV